MIAPFAAAPELLVTSRDGTPVAVFAGEAGPRRAPVLLVHGTGSDHTTWRVLAPLLARSWRVHAMDRRGRGASGDGPAYRAGREVEDVVAVAERLEAATGRPVAVVGHSLGGRIALAAAARTASIARVVAYESAPGPPGDAGRESHEALLRRLRADLLAGDGDAVLARFLREAAGLPADELDAFRSSPLWPIRVATAGTIVRELDAALHDAAIGIDALAGTSVPVLQVVGSASASWFRGGAALLDGRLADARLVSIDGARHGAHHTHAQALAALIEAFLAR